MENKEIINKIVKFTESLVDGCNVNEAEFLDLINLSYIYNRDLSVYRGILTVYYYIKFNKMPNEKFVDIGKDEIFLKCVSILNGNSLSPTEIGGLFLSILNIPEKDLEKRNILLGSFYGSLWQFMNNTENFEIAVDYGVEIAKAAFSLDKFNFLKKIQLNKGNAKIINLAGSGKKEIKLLNISSMTAVVTAAVGMKIGTNLIVEKTISRSTSSISGSSDIFESVGINLNTSIDDMANISLKTKLGVFDINKIVPQLNHIYDGYLYDIQIFAGLIGGAAIVNPIEANLINYGLTRGSGKLCLAILNKLYPDKNIVIVQGKNQKGQTVVDQMSIVANTEIFQRINGVNSLRIMSPSEFGFDYAPFKYIQTTKSSKENIKLFIKLIGGQGNENLAQAVAMEVALNLYGLELINNLKQGANLALEEIQSGTGIKILENLVSHSNGDKIKFNNLIKDYLN